ncbi:hypothetical protein GOY17_18415 [Lysobacter soli]|uniref:hypothetical protein n=1 Tax=Lysobacter soli TaxID=453783 RepID=UPI0012EDA9C2|nr:hypothetical protein [Lysobacter soli]QGW66689.1 hypothetical protein GOY17_18415 [Lysobacter soli]
MATATTAAPIFGDKLYQERARAALPILVRQAEAATPISYSSLAAELGMPNPRNLNYVLGCVGQTMEYLQIKKGTPIPPIQCLVVNKATGLPGEGIGWFVVKKESFADLPLKRRREIIQFELQRVTAFEGWRGLLADLGLKPQVLDFSAALEAAAAYRGAGESAEHKQLKEFVARNPAVIGLSPAITGDTELPLPSGDCLDVSFKSRGAWVAAEIKSTISNAADITRGIFQCVKYRAVLEAAMLAKNEAPSARAILVLGGRMPPEQVLLANLLGVEFVDGVVPT